MLVPSSRVIAPEMTGTGSRAPVGSTWLGYVDTKYKALGLHREITEQFGYDKLTGALREKLSDAEIEKLTAKSAAWSEDQAVEEALKI